MTIPCVFKDPEELERQVTNHLPHRIAALNLKVNFMLAFSGVTLALVGLLVAMFALTLF